MQNLSVNFRTIACGNNLNSINRGVESGRDGGVRSTDRDVRGVDGGRDGVHGVDNGRDGGRYRRC